MKTSSAKAKGRRLQQEVAALIRQWLDLPETDVKSLPMGAQGCDVWLSAKAQERCPLAFECKNVEKINIWAAIKQAEDNSTIEAAPAVVFARNRQEPYVAIPLGTLMVLLQDRYLRGMR